MAVGAGMKAAVLHAVDLRVPPAQMVYGPGRPPWHPPLLNPSIPFISKLAACFERSKAGERLDGWLSGPPAGLMWRLLPPAAWLSGPPAGLMWRLWPPAGLCSDCRYAPWLTLGLGGQPAHVVAVAKVMNPNSS